MTGEHPTPFGRASSAVARDRTAQNLFEKTPNMDQLEANQIIRTRHGPTQDAEGQPTIYKQNFHE